VTEWVTGEEVLEFVGITAPTAGETTWAAAVAVAVSSGIDTRLNGGTVPAGGPEGEVQVAAVLAAAEAFRRRTAPFGVTGYADLQGVAIRVARDYLEGVKPLVDRYSNGPGIG
jgi:hypothetical protein